ncbi:MAG: LacI family DNA-binding transcriptional regulator [Lapillicoccus sp.]
MARLAGVSQATVSRALRPGTSVPDATRQRVERAARVLGYVPNRLGRSLVTSETGRIAMVADLGNPLFSTLLTPIHDVLSELGYQTLLLAEHQDRVDVYSGLFDRSVDGAILSTAKIGSVLPFELDRHAVPFVYLSRLVELVERDSVSADDIGGAARVGALFAELGHRHVGAILGPSDTSTSRDREHGFMRQLALAGIAVPPEAVVRTDYTTPNGYAAFRRLMDLDPRPTALFCGNDWLAVGALNGARELGIRVPGELTVVGFDDLAVASWPVFDLTTVSNPVKDSAAQAARLLVRRITSGPGAPYEHLVAPTDLVLRSTHAPPV